jgi:hypothetical protein
MFSNLFTVTETTLLYHDISTFGIKKTSYGTVEDWGSHVPVARPSSRKPTPVPTVPVGSSTTAVPTFRTTGNSSTIAVTVNDVAKAKKSTKSSKSSKSSQPLRSGIGLKDDSIFEDESAEREAAHLSPLKGVDRLANAVRHISSSALFLTVVFCSALSGLSTSHLYQSAREIERRSPITLTSLLAVRTRTYGVVSL